MAIQARELDDDAALVLAVQAGDTGAYTELFQRHYPSVRRVCARRLGNLVDADEVAQAAFVRAYERIDRCAGERRFGPWVQVIAHRLCIDQIRARTRTTPDEEPVKGAAEIGPNAPEEAVLRAERTAKVHEALALLPARQREVVVARHLEGRRPPEIAAAFGMSVGAVDSLLLRARRKLATSYNAVLTDAGASGLPTTVATSAIGTVAATQPSAISRGWSAVQRAVDDLAARASGLVGSGVPSPFKAAAAAIAVAGVAALPPADAPRPARPPAVAAPARPALSLPTTPDPGSQNPTLPTVTVPTASELSGQITGLETPGVAGDPRTGEPPPVLASDGPVAPVTAIVDSVVAPVLDPVVAIATETVDGVLGTVNGLLGIAEEAPQGP